MINKNVTFQSPIINRTPSPLNNLNYDNVLRQPFEKIRYHRSNFKPSIKSRSSSPIRLEQLPIKLEPPPIKLEQNPVKFEPPPIRRRSLSSVTNWENPFIFPQEDKNSLQFRFDTSSRSRDPSPSIRSKESSQSEKNNLKDV